MDQSRKSFSKHDRTRIEKLEKDQQDLQKIVNTGSKFTAEEKACMQYTKAEDFNKHWMNTQAAGSKFEESHTNGCGLWTRRFQGNAVIAQGFLDGCVPIIKIVQDFAYPYGNVAIGTISLVLVIAQNKANTESIISSTLSAIKDRLLAIKLYEHIYNDNHELDAQLQTKIVDTYECFIGFCIEATKYYRLGGPKRWLTAIFHTSPLLEQSEEVQKHFTDLRRTCEDLLHKNVANVKDICLSQSEHIRVIEGLLTEMRDDNDHRFVTELQELLDCQSFSTEAHQNEFSGHRKALVEAQEEQAEGAFWVERLTPEKLMSYKQDPAMKQWDEATRPSLLIVVGYSEESVFNSTEHCWLSPLAVDRIDQFLPSQNCEAFAYFVLSRKDKFSDLAVIQSLLFQLLRRRIDKLRTDNERDALRGLLKQLQSSKHIANGPSPQNEGPYRREQAAMLLKVALHVVGMFDASETVNIVVDRLDWCQPAVAGGRKALLNTLVQMAERSRANVKIMVIVSGDNWPGQHVKEYIHESFTNPKCISIFEKWQGKGE